MSASGRIIEGIKDAIAGNLASVMIEGQEWRPVSGWQPIETAPTIGGLMLLFDPRIGIRVGHYRRSSGWAFLPGEYSCHPTHWQRYPDLPK